MLNESDLRPYQRRAVDFTKRHDNCMLFVDMGLGKTASTLTAFAELQSSFDARRMLVIAPLRVARKVWSDEVKAWAHVNHLSVSPMTGTVQQRMAALRKPTDIHTLGRENCQWLEAQFIQNDKQIVKWPWDMVVLDESQSWKSQSSARWKSLRRLRRLFPRCVALTGTPAPNGYADLWSQFYLLDQGKRLGATETAYLERWFDRPRQDGLAKWTLKAGSKKQIQEAVAGITLALREEDYLSLPPVVYNPIWVQLPPHAMQTYREMARKFIAEVKGKTLTAVNAGVLDGKLLQLANGTVYTGEGREWVPFHDEKLQALEELLEGVGGKLLVAYYYRHDKERIERVLEASGRCWSILKSDKEFDRWAAGGLDVGLLHPASAGHGLNDVYKAGAEDLVHYGLTADLQLWQQVNARLTGGHRRAGKNIRIHYIVAEGTRDEGYIDLLKDKDADQDELTLGVARMVTATA